MRQLLRLVPLCVLPLLLTGCRYKGWESFTQATTNVKYGKIVGDPGSFGSLSAANGGLKTETNYGAGADVNSAGKVNPSFDQPEKGSGQEQGQYPNVAAPGFGQDNGPALQPQPGSVGDVGNPLAHG